MLFLVFLGLTSLCLLITGLMVRKHKTCLFFILLAWLVVWLGAMSGARSGMDANWGGSWEMPTTSVSIFYLRYLLGAELVLILGFTFTCWGEKVEPRPRRPKPERARPFVRTDLKKRGEERAEAGEAPPATLP